MGQTEDHADYPGVGASPNQVVIRVRYADVDRMGVAYYARYLEWFEVGRTEWLRHLGRSYRQMEEEGLYLPVVEVYCRYLCPARYDDLIVVTTSVEGTPRATLKLSHRISRQADGELLAEGYTVQVFVNGEGKAVRPPKWFREALDGGIRDAKPNH